MVTPLEAARAMYDRDGASQALGMRLVDVGPGSAIIEMEVTAEMVNGLDVCHGGLIFTLADSAMAFASNSYNQYAIAVHADIDWVNPGRLGATLRATATERSKRGRNAITDVVVDDVDGSVIAHFRGRTRLIDGTHVSPADTGSGEVPAGDAG